MNNYLYKQQKKHGKSKKPFTKERVHTIWLHLHKILEQVKLIYDKKFITMVAYGEWREGLTGNFLA